MRADFNPRNLDGDGELDFPMRTLPLRLIRLCPWLLACRLSIGLAALVPAMSLWAQDCNQNGVADSEDIRNGTSPDCNRNGIPDECERMFPRAYGWWVGDAPVDLLAEDLDGDGLLDLAVANQGTDDISVLRGAGDGTFELQERVP